MRWTDATDCMALSDVVAQAYMIGASPHQHQSFHHSTLKRRHTSISRLSWVHGHAFQSFILYGNDCFAWHNPHCVFFRARRYLRHLRAGSDICGVIRCKLLQCRARRGPGCRCEETIYAYPPMGDPTAYSASWERRCNPHDYP